MSLLAEHIEASVAAIGSLRQVEAAYERACDTLAEALKAGRKILACGNGGSAADSGHFTTELLCRYVNDRAPLAAISLAHDGSFLTAAGNDYGFEDVFARQIRGLGQAGDVLVGFTTSGESRNIRAAFLAAKESGLISIALLGRSGGVCRGLAEIEIIVPVQETAHIQEAHKVLIHAFCAGIERRLFGT